MQKERPIKPCNPNRTRQQYLLTLVVLLISIGVSPLASATSIQLLVNQRLAYMKDVAAYKWINQRPIEDLAREQIVVKRAVEDGLQHGITVESSERFFRLQIDAAKEIQNYWFDRWGKKLSKAPRTSPDLISDIRPALISLGNQISEALSATSTAGDGVKVEGLSNASARQLENAINNITFYPNRLAQILDSKMIRVGTTGDYAPFSADNHTEDSTGVNAFSGIDIDLAEDLAKSLDAKILWSKTSWPTLLDDLQQNQFDIGMSGISVNLKRQRYAYFSLPYHTGGKTPIGRCVDTAKFNSLKRIDATSTRVVVNPGGTNERFVNSRLKNAKVILHPDNRTIFDLIINREADVMFTDAIEVSLQTHRHPTLCAMMPGQTLTFQQKAYLLPQDMVWKNFVDTWLKQRIGDGTVEAIFKQHLD